jgi:hypothetical protein
MLVVLRCVSGAVIAVLKSDGRGSLACARALPYDFTSTIRRHDLHLHLSVPPMFQLPVEPVRENEENHPLTLQPFERLPAVEQANISGVHALAAAEVAANAVGGETSGEAAESGVEGESGEGSTEDEGEAAGPVAQAGTGAPTLSAPGRKRALKALEKSALALTAKAEAAMQAVDRAELRIEQEQEQLAPSQRQGQHTHTADRKPEDLGMSGPVSLSATGNTDSKEEAALLVARRQVDDALRRIADKHRGLQRGAQPPAQGLLRQGALGGKAARTRKIDDDEQAGEREGTESVERKMSRAARDIYRHYEVEYEDAVKQSHSPSEAGQARATAFSSPKARQQSLQAAGRHSSLSSAARDYPTSGPLERATSVRDVRFRTWPLVGQYGHTHSWPYVAMDGDLVVQNEDPVVAPTDCAQDPISVECTGDVPAAWRHVNAP